VSVTKTP